MSRRASGFILLELLVALVVAGVAVAIGYTALASVTDAAARSRAASEPIFAAAAARSTLGLWLGSATLMDGTEPFRGVHRLEGPIRSDELSLAVSSGGSLRLGPRRLRLWVDTDPTTTARGLMGELAPIGADRLSSTDTLRIAPTAAGLAARYLVRVDGRERWVDAWVSETQLPRAIELTILELAQARLARASVAGGLPPLLTIPILAPVMLESW